MPDYFGKVTASRFLLPLALLLGPVAADLLAGNPVTEIHAGDIPKGTVALGAGWRFGDSPYVGIDDVGSIWHDNGYDLMPFYYYEGKWLFSHGSKAGKRTDQR